MLARRIALFVLILFLTAARGAGAERITFTMTAGPYRIVETEEGFHRIEMSGFTLRGEPGEPSLPLRVYHFALPPGAVVRSVEILGEHDEILEGAYRIGPAPGVIPLNAGQEAVRTSRRDWQAAHDAVYRSDEIHPAAAGWSLGTAGARKYTLLRVAFSPFAYRPATERLLWCRRAEVVVEFDRPCPGTDRYRRVEEILADPAPDSDLLSLLDNPGQARPWYRRQEGRAAAKSTYDYVIITTSGLQGSVTGLAEWKEELGHTVNVVTTDWISGQYSGSDLPEKIRNFLVDTYAEWGIEYVLLAADIDLIPMRYCYPSGHSNAVPTDYYYADLTGDWDSDGDHYYGEPDQDAIDLMAEVSVGRIPYSSSGALGDICSKLAATESDTGSWKDSALLPGAFINFANEDWSGYSGTDGAWAAQRMIEDVFVGWDVTTLYEKSGLAPSALTCDFPLTGANVVSQWSANDFGIVAWAAHGSDDAAWRKYWNWDDGDGVPESNEMAWSSFFDVSDVSSLDDTRPAIVFCASCENGHPEVDHLARELLGNGSCGAVAATRVSYGIIGWTQKDDGGIESLSYYFHDHLINKDQPVGDALYNSKYFCWTHNWQNYQNMYDFCLYGDPALRRAGMAATPQVAAAEPAPNVYLADPAGDLTVAFDRPMDPATLNDSTLRVTGELRGRYPGAVSYDAGSMTVTLDPAEDFLAGERVDVQITSGAGSAAGTPVSGGWFWSFRTLAPGGSAILDSVDLFGAGLDPSAVCAGDLDRDGDVDLVVAGLSLDQTSVWLNDGLGGFTPDGAYGTGSDPRGLTAGDFNGDGFLDLATADSSDHQVSVLLNDGDGTFAAAQSYATSQRPRDLTAADLDGDGNPDLAVAASQYDRVSVLLNDGDGTFTPAGDLGVGGQPRAVVAADLNGDGRCDLITANYGSDDLSVLLNEGGGAFAAAVSYAAGDGPHGLCAADLNDDGRVDAAVANRNSGDVTILLNTGTGLLAADSAYAAGSQPLCVRVSDLDGDEDGDLVAACAGDDQVRVLINLGDGTFQAVSGVPAGTAPVSLCAADLDGDGDPDVAAANRVSGDLTILSNIDALKVTAISPPLHQRSVPDDEDPAVSFNSPLDPATLSDSVFIVTGAQSGRHFGPVTAGSGDSVAIFSPSEPFADGEMVSVMLTSGLKSHIGIPMNAGYGWSFFIAAGGQGQFDRDSSWAAGNTPQGIAAADLDGDGLVDLTTANYQASSVGVFFNDGNGGFVLDSLYRVDDGPVRVCPLDLEGDGDLDLASVNAWDYTVSVLRNQGGEFSHEADYLVGTSPYDMCAADLNGDGTPELITANAGDDDISILFNDGSGDLSQQTRYPVGDVPWGVAAGDTDGDGDLDLLVSNWIEKTFSVLANKGNGIFSDQVKYPTESEPKALTVGELDGDGHLDLVLAGPEEGMIMVSRGSGDGTFAADSVYGVAGEPCGLTVVDLDGDGDQDLAVTRAADDSVTVMTNDGGGRFQHRQTFTTGDRPMGVCGLEADGDHAVDLAVVCYDDDLLILRYNTATVWPPAPVNDLIAALGGDILRLTWSPVTVDQMGQPLVVDRYVIYRHTDPHFVPDPGDSLGGTADCFYDDTGAALKNPGVNHYYVVKAVDAAGGKSAASGAVGEFDMPLESAAGKKDSGWTKR